MRGCCTGEAKRQIRKHRDVAICDECGRLVLGYGNELEWKKTRDELAKNGVAFEAGKVGNLLVIAKDRSAAKSLEDSEEDDADGDDAEEKDEEDEEAGGAEDDDD